MLQFSVNAYFFSKRPQILTLMVLLHTVATPPCPCFFTDTDILYCNQRITIHRVKMHQVELGFIDIFESNCKILLDRHAPLRLVHSFTAQEFNEYITPQQNNNINHVQVHCTCCPPTSPYS